MLGQSEEPRISEDLNHFFSQNHVWVWGSTLLALANLGVSIYYWKEVQKIRAEQKDKEAKEKEEKMEEIKEKEFHQIAEPSTEYYRNQGHYIFNFCDTYPWN